ncbi:NAD-dependent succinate-semialdehyde dehydrogenase [Alteromonas oceani]|jgi:succinate-semialdehyde dehydrogenase/glutarate-semialdehyde dehydrogenase|uniref:NAD-dependent succinate-semialdehyde dehydrogenase n=1 Tax=Alteromonas oceani TaxID=2071609 RepID=A0ABV7JUM6_9ALTE|nr:NAD-dependent succinate-semialdehyde dehydrogenase [Alteromonas oceani]HAU93625.1 succinate-semialdehyde dehydrogenase (NADP(+)) [Alteromonas sp.]HCA77552.1 succinate-semialdehyde dehydrogenase (NADP(+)) [Alteromonas sp.]HCL11562.1 succinate-semialdehyde dehydrogenase (NADP(+)) [Alteromonas sp.]HCV16956.1 succinate-semialdehyde dehydrogenase (NADP(+)) [Alteromonas sp.]|tara:strand:+ start:1605 stop:3056 length:1452 start_codon:yes stop_codon:yes gene_type:complete
MTLNDIDIFKQACLINGEWVTTSDSLEVDNPATGEVIATIPQLDADAVNQAVTAANDAFKLWRKKTPAERGELVRKWYELMVEHTDELATIMTTEQGKPLAEAKGEIAYAASYVKWFAEEAMRINGEILPAGTPDTQIRVSRDPVGVCAAITPWNFPAAMITRKVAPALAAGCTIIVKPASQTPLTALALGELAIQAGIPKGVIQVITGKASVIGDALCENSTVRKLTFTGSTEIGSQLMKKCAPDVKKLSLELGGNAPFIVFEDADIDLAVDGLMKGKFRNAGQTCISPNRVYVQRSVLEEFQTKLVKKVEALKVGNGLDDGVDIGPLIDAAGADKVTEHVDNALSNGATLLTGGKRLPNGDNWYTPTVLTNVPPTAQCTCEETFGPLVPIIPFDTEEEVIEYANDTPFGLAAYFFSDDLHRAQRVVDAIESGMVGVNTGAISAANAPFGGVKASGLGREGAHAGIEEYLEMKYQCYAIKQA